MRNAGLCALLIAAVVAAGTLVSGHEHHHDAEAHEDCATCTLAANLDAGTSDCSMAQPSRNTLVDELRVPAFDIAPIPIATLHLRGPPRVTA